MMSEAEKRPRKLGISREDNPEFHEVADGYNELMAKWNDVNRRLHDLGPPGLLPFGYKGKLKALKGPLKQLHEDYISWEHKAAPLFYNPHFTFPSDDSAINFIHYSNVLSSLRSEMDHRMVLITENANKRYDSYQGQVNFIIAIASFMLTFIGLVATLLTLG